MVIAHRGRQEQDVCTPMGDGNDAVGGDEAGLKDVHVLPTDGVVQLK